MNAKAKNREILYAWPSCRWSRPRQNA